MYERFDRSKFGGVKLIFFFELNSVVNDITEFRGTAYDYFPLNSLKNQIKTTVSNVRKQNNTIVIF